ncbi:MAG: hypothetical protein KBD76_16195 [Bacteriovorax sp.]|nr:hypothetical protein [Bacteriovorax sp.]
MSDLNFLNCEKYIIDKILEIKSLTSLIEKKNRVSQFRSEETDAKIFKFGSLSSVEFNISIYEDEISVESFYLEKEYFMLTSFLHKNDSVSASKYEEVLSSCRKSHSFQYRIDSQLNFIVDYINKCSDLKLVLEGKKWFNVLYDFGGMK